MQRDDEMTFDVEKAKTRRENLEEYYRLRKNGYHPECEPICVSEAAEMLPAALDEIERLQDREQQLLLDVDRNYREKKEYAARIQELEAEAKKQDEVIELIQESRSMAYEAGKKFAEGKIGELEGWLKAERAAKIRKEDARFFFGGDAETEARQQLIVEDKIDKSIPISANIVRKLASGESKPFLDTIGISDQFVEPTKLMWRPEVQAFAEAMERKLRQNDHKGGWKKESVAWLEKRLTEEGAELAHEIKKFRDKQETADKERLLSEMADFMNFLMMLADVTGCLEIGNGDQCPDVTKLMLTPEQQKTLEAMRTIVAYEDGRCSLTAEQRAALRIALDYIPKHPAKKSRFFAINQIESLLASAAPA